MLISVARAYPGLCSPPGQADVRPPNVCAGQGPGRRGRYRRHAQRDAASHAQHLALSSGPGSRRCRCRSRRGEGLARHSRSLTAPNPESVGSLIVVVGFDDPALAGTDRSRPGSRRCCRRLGV